MYGYKIYPKMEIFCPKENKELEAQESCLKCDFFKGVTIDKSELRICLVCIWKGEK